MSAESAWINIGQSRIDGDLVVGLEQDVVLVEIITCPRPNNRLPMELQHLLAAWQAGSQVTVFTNRWLHFGLASLLAREEYHTC